MCFVLLSLGFHKGTKLVLCVNRDEFFDRFTHPTKFWEHPYNDILGAQDEKGGAQCAVTKQGRFAVITTYRKCVPLVSGETVFETRGKLALKFLSGTQTIEELLQELQDSAFRYDGYNIIVGDVNNVWYYSNKSGARPEQLKKGRVYGLSNALLDSDWYKVRTGKEKFSNVKNVHNSEELFGILSATEPGSAHDVELQMSTTGVDKEAEFKMSSTFCVPFAYNGKPFGTRSQHLLVVDEDNKVDFEFDEDDLSNLESTAAKLTYSTIDDTDETAQFDLTNKTIKNDAEDAFAQHQSTINDIINLSSFPLSIVFLKKVLVHSFHKVILIWQYNLQNKIINFLLYHHSIYLPTTLFQG